MWGAVGYVKKSCEDSSSINLFFGRFGIIVFNLVAPVLEKVLNQFIIGVIVLLC